MGDQPGNKSGEQEGADKTARTLECFPDSFVDRSPHRHFSVLDFHRCVCLKEDSCGGGQGRAFLKAHS